MPDNKGNLYLYEAIELRSEYDRHISLLAGLMGESSKKRGLFKDDDEDKEPAADFDQKKTNEELKKLQTRRIKLNQEIQKTNFDTQVEYKGEKVSIAEALEIRKNLLVEVKTYSERVEKSSSKRVIHKEGRDIVQEPRHRFSETYNEYQECIQQLRQLVNRIHAINHMATVSFKNE
ncbi:hypothetical protein C4544_03730 [candidate division WS5 bacterium]|uniref:Uncharacterized protein n=1 Tax=candidate division WS5 bacterium TaxID=2093353 RepID=A0A419DD98_9BACT|nr:MAG: hypothetical protein C4544_03730 [candidate division WS5 bacterium]